MFDLLKNIGSNNKTPEKGGLLNAANKNINLLGNGGAVLSAIDDGVVALDKDGKITIINHAAENLTGWSDGDAEGLIYTAILKISNNDGQEMIDAANPINKVLRTSTSFISRDLFLKTQSGKVLPIYLAINPIDNFNSGVVVVFRDISKELLENREQAEFISTASHEMRTPVASIEGYLGLALNPATATIDERAKGFLLKAHENTKHLGQLFQDLLDITKSEDGRLKNEPVVLNAVEFAREIWDGLKVKAENKDLEYIFEPDHHKSGEITISPVFYIHADRDHLHEVLGNLFDNAIKYTPFGKVSVNVTGDNDNVRISVADSGIGIPAEDIPHLFQKFYRVDNSETREVGGTGLGLYLSRRLVEAMGGKIELTSEYKKGSTFTITLPRLARDQAERLKEAEDQKMQELKEQAKKEARRREEAEADRDILSILGEEDFSNKVEEQKQSLDNAKEIKPISIEIENLATPTPTPTPTQIPVHVPSPVPTQIPMPAQVPMQAVAPQPTPVQTKAPVPVFANQNINIAPQTLQQSQQTPQQTPQQTYTPSYNNQQATANSNTTYSPVNNVTSQNISVQPAQTFRVPEPPKPQVPAINSINNNMVNTQKTFAINQQNYNYANNSIAYQQVATNSQYRPNTIANNIQPIAQNNMNNRSSVNNINQNNYSRPQPQPALSDIDRQRALYIQNLRQGRQ